MNGRSFVSGRDGFMMEEICFVILNACFDALDVEGLGVHMYLHRYEYEYMMYT
jgi:hypothetical protein